MASYKNQEPPVGMITMRCVVGTGRLILEYVDSTFGRNIVYKWA